MNALETESIVAIEKAFVKYLNCCFSGVIAIRLMGVCVSN